MNCYMEQLKAYLHEIEKQEGFGGIPSILDFLWSCYSCEHPVDDGRLKDAERTLMPILEELSLDSSDIIFNHIVKLCTCYQRAAFLEGIQVGARLSIELSK